nr:F-box protein CPR1-like [Ziziphus jujuba var. spinosa]
MAMNHEFGESLSSESSSSRSESFVNVYDLTEDLVREILMRLPVVDVIKMKRVCKSLYSLINSSDFIAKYSLLDGDRDPYMFISIPFKGTRVVSVSDEDDDDDDATVNRVIHIRPTPTQPQPQAHRLFCYCCCDGVLLVSFVGFKNNCGQFALWNPATGDIKDVPTYDHYKNLSDCDDGGEEYDLYVTNYGCGFDSKTNEYRPFIVLSDKCYSFKTEIEIYSYKKKIWKIIQSSGIISHEIDMVYANGFCHWPGFSRLGGPNGRDVIVSFDVINEVILITPFPDDIIPTYSYQFPYYYYRHCPFPLLLNDSVALVVNRHGHWNRDDNRTRSCFDIWVLGEYGDKDSWTKLFTIGPLHGIQHVLGFWSETKTFLAQTDSLDDNVAQLLLYDTVIQQPFNCLQTIKMDSKVHTCRLSLLPIAADGSKKTKIKRRVRVRVLAIEIRNHNKKMKKKIKTWTGEGSCNYFIVVNNKRVRLADC